MSGKLPSSNQQVDASTKLEVPNQNEVNNIVSNSGTTAPTPTPTPSPTDRKNGATNAADF
ncbi:MAG TPA: hypothetical protein VN698_03170 [Bacteroidia bacterium]|nr:hypothetical protein [Bacteroidia bacterium]